MIDERYFEKYVRRFGPDGAPAIIMTPAFGDQSHVYEPLVRTKLCDEFRLILTELPGFGGSPALDGRTTLQTLADYVGQLALREEATILVAHSVASITASLAAGREGSQVDTIIALEGNLTPEDAYHSGTAAEFDDAQTFKTTFLQRLRDLESSDIGIARFRQAIEKADAQALWELGCDAAKFSSAYMPGEILQAAAKHVCYLYDPKNCPSQTLGWLENNDIGRVRLGDVSHWMSFHQPDRTAAAILKALKRR